MFRRTLTFVLAAAATTTLLAAPPTSVAIGWDDFRHYVAAHAWIADIDFRDGKVQGMHVCAGFNAFNHYAKDSTQMRRYGFANAAQPDRLLQAAAFAITMNSPTVLERGFGYVKEVIGSPEYEGKSGEERLAYAREVLWGKVASDQEIKAAVEETVGRLQQVTAKLVDAGLLSAEAAPENPFTYMLGVNSVLRDPEIVDAILTDAAFLKLETAQQRRDYFGEQFARRVAEASGIEGEADRDGYRASILESMGQLFDAGGSFTVSLSR